MSIGTRLGLQARARAVSEYDAFISYSHASDTRLATEFQRGLQRFAKPWYRPRALRVFRDEASLSADPALWGSISRALDSSGHFILLASRQVAASPWVARETEYWREHKPMAQMIIGLTDGQLLWDEAAEDFDWETTNVLPPSLRGAFAEEPRYIDLRWTRDEPELSLSHPRFRDAVAEFAAPLHGKDKDELSSAEVREHRRTVRITRAAVATLLALTALAIVAGLTALAQRSRAIAARNQAVAAGKLSLSRALAGEAAAVRGADPARAALLSLEAYRSAPTFEARDAVVKSLEGYRDGILHGHSGPVRSVAVDPAGKLIASGSNDGTIRLWEASTGQPRGTPLRVGAGVDVVAFDPAGRYLASGQQDPSGSRLSAALWDMTNGRRVMSFGGLYDEVTDLAFSGDGHELALATVSGTIHLWDLVHRRETRTIAGPNAQLGTNGNWLRNIALSGDGKVLAAVDDTSLDPQGGIVRLWSTSTGAPLRALGGGSPTGFELINSVAFAPSGPRIAIGESNGTITLVDVVSHSLLARSSAASGPVTDLSFAPDGSILASSSSDGSVRLWNPATAGLLTQPLAGSEGPTNAVALGPRNLLVSGNADSTVRIWDPRRLDQTGFSVMGTPLSGPDATGGSVVGFSPDGHLVGVGDPSGAISVFDSRSGTELANSTPGTINLNTTPREAFGPGNLHAQGRDDGTIVVTGGPQGRTVLRGHQGPVNQVDFSANGRELVSGGADGTVRVWNVATGQPAGSPLYGHASGVERVDFTTDPRVVVSAGSDATARLWSLTSGRELGDPLPLSAATAGVPGASTELNPGGTYVDLARAGDGRFVALASNASEPPVIFPGVLTSQKLKTFQQTLCPWLTLRLGRRAVAASGACA